MQFHRGILPLSLLLASACNSPAVGAEAAKQQRFALAGGNLPVYIDWFQDPFEDWSWAMHNMANTSPVHSGKASVSMDPSGYGGVKFHSSHSVPSGLYTSLDFYVNGGSAGGQSLRVGLDLDTNVTTPWVLAESVVGGQIPANGWAHATIPLTAFNIGSAGITDIIFMGNSGSSVPELYLDDISLIAGVPAMLVYDDQPENGFTNISWGSGTVINETSVVHSGNSAISFTPNNWNGIQLRIATKVNLSNYTGLSFWVNGGSAGGQVLWAGVTGTPSGQYRLPLAKYLPSGSIQANTWQQVTVPLADIGAAQVQADSVYIMDGTGHSQSQVYIDDISLVSGVNGVPALPDTTPPPAEGTTTGSAPTTPATTGGTTTGGSTTGGTTASSPGGGTTTGSTSGGNSNSNSTGGTSGGTTGWLYTKGNRIFNSDGSLFKGRGANIADPRGCGACTGTDLATSTQEVIRRLDLLTDTWGANFVRLDLESYNSSSILTDSSYLAAIQQIVAHVGTKPGVVIEVSVWVDPSLSSTGWPTTQTDQILATLAQTFYNVPYVIFGISNEPQSNYDGSLDADVWDAMNAAAASIRAAEAAYGSNKHLIAAQGTGGWARFLQYYMTHPLTAGDGSNFIYEVHVYDAASTFQDRFITPSTVIPVIIGEFGPSSGFMTLSDCSTLVTQAQQAGVPYMGWTFHMRCPPNLLVDNSNGGCGVGMTLTPTSDWGALLQKQLAQPW